MTELRFLTLAQTFAHAGHRSNRKAPAGAGASAKALATAASVELGIVRLLPAVADSHFLKTNAIEKFSSSLLNWHEPDLERTILFARARHRHESF